MANVLIVDPHGRRLLRLDVALQRAGHRTYAAGRGAEAMRLAEVYVPAVVVIAGDLPDMRAAELISRLRASTTSSLRDSALVVPRGVSGNGALPVDVSDPRAVVAAVCQAAGEP